MLVNPGLVRLWIVLSIAWVAVSSVIAFSAWETEPSSLPRDVGLDMYFGRTIEKEDAAAFSHNVLLVMLVLLPPPAIFALSVGLAWAVKGFDAPNN